MNELNHYPWQDKFQIPEEKLKEWKQSSAQNSLTFYALKNRLINKKEYFDWAIEHYQTPKVDDMYFEENLMKKDDWNKIKDTYDWTEEVLPIAFWNNTIFVGCVELSHKVPKQILGFDSRIVLVNQKNLEVTWSFFNTLSDIIEKTSTGVNYRSPGLKVEREELSKIKKEETPAKMALKTEKLKGTFEPDLPVKKKNYPQPFLQSSQSFPEEERQRQTPSEETFPGRSLPQEEDQFLFMKKKEEESAFEKNKELLVDSKKKTSKLSSSNDLKPKQGLKLVKDSIPSVKSVFTPPPLSSVKKSKVTELTQNFTETHITSTDKTNTDFSILSGEQNNYKVLWDYTKKYYCSSIIFNVKEDKAFLDSFTGKIKLKSEDKFYVDFKEYNLFKVVQRGYPYNGFVVDSAANKKFFADLGWDKYPQYTTAIPIKDSSENIKKIFVGFSLKTFSKQEIQNIQKDILDIFQKRKLSQAA